MPVDFLTERERAQLKSFPPEISPEDINAFFTLSAADLGKVKMHKGDYNQLGFALQLCTLRYLGFSPDKLLEVATPVLAYLAYQLGVLPETLQDYGERAQTRTEHLQEIQTYLEFREVTQDELSKATDWLLERALEHERPTLLFQMLCEKFYREKTVRPGVTILERLVANARKRAQLVVYRRLEPIITAEFRNFIDDSLLMDDTTGRTTLAWLRKKSEVNKPRAILQSIERLNFLKSLKVETWDLSQLSPNKIKLLYQIGKKSTVHELARLSEVSRYPILIAFLKQSAEEITDEIVEIFDRCLADTDARARRDLDDFRKSVAKTTNEKLKLLEELANLILDTENIRDAQLRAAIYERIPPQKLETTVQECKKIMRPGDDNHIDFFGNRYQYLRQFIPALLNALELRSTHQHDPVLDAIALLRHLDDKQQRHIPDGTPIDFVPAKWKPYVVDNTEQINRRYYELCVLCKLREALRSGNIWVKGSHRYANPESYLIPRDHWRNIRQETCRLLQIPANSEEQLKYKQTELEELLERVENNLAHNKNARIEDGKLVVSHFQAEELPASAKKLSQLITERLPSVELSSLLIEVDAWTHFSRYFEHAGGSEPRNPELLVLLYAAILTQACNFGLFKMAEIASLSYPRLTWCTKWYLREETLKPAFSHLANFQYHQTLSKAWGSGTFSSSDGQRFLAARNVRKATALPRYFAYSCGLTCYGWTSDLSSQYNNKIIPTTTRDATYVLDGILDNETELPILEHTTDTAGYTYLVFALFDLIGLRFSPRLRDIGDQCLYKFDPTQKYYNLDAVVTGKIDTKLIQENWDELLRVAASLKLGWVPASLLISKLTAYPRQNILVSALQEYGRIQKTIFILQYLDSEEYQRRIGIQLNKGEALNELHKFLFFANRAKIVKKQEEELLNQASCLTLVTNAVIAWNTVYMAAVIEQLKREGVEIKEEDLVHLSPCRFEHINPYGKYTFNLDETFSQGKLRPLKKT